MGIECVDRGHNLQTHQHLSSNIEYTDTNTRTNQQQDIVDIKPTSGSDYWSSAIGRATQEGTDDTAKEVYPTLCFNKILPLLLLFRKVSL